MLVWHVHHTELVEFVRDEKALRERIGEIKRWKAPAERPVRLAAITPVIGPLPERLQEAMDNMVKSWGRGNFSDASHAFDQAMIHEQEALYALHAIEHPDCPWVGQDLLHNLNYCPICSTYLPGYGTYDDVRAHARYKHNVLLRSDAKGWTIVPREGGQR